MIEGGGIARGGALYSLALELETERELRLEPSQGYRAYALLLHLLEQHDPAFSQAIHDLPGQKPITISPLLGAESTRERAIVLKAGDHLWLRVTAIGEEVFAHVLDCLLHAPTGASSRLDDATFRLTRIVSVPGKTIWADCTTFADLVARSEPTRSIGVRFWSPTAFRVGGTRNFVLPMPELVFGSLLARWNQFAPLPMPPDLKDTARDAVWISRHQLRTQMLDFGNHRELGFVGECVYEVSPAVKAADSARLAALARFAYYSGVGAKTTMGMGQASWIETARRKAAPGV